VVTARGDILTASDTENADLFWGIRGAGCNLGVVTEFVLRLHPQRRTVFAGILAFPPPAIPKAVETVINFWNQGLLEKETIFYAQTADPNGNPLALIILFLNGSEDEGLAHFKPFFDIGPVMNTCKEIPYEELNSIQNFNVKPGSNFYIKGIFSSGPQVGVAEKLVSRHPELSKNSGLNLITLFELIPTNKVLTVPNNATAHIRGPRVNVAVMASWPGTDKDANKLEAARSAAAELSRIVIDGETIIPESENTGYGNYTSEEVTSAAAGRTGIKAEALFGENYARLQKLKKEYDPDLIFFKWTPITPQA